MFFILYMSCGAKIDALLFSGVVHCTKVESDYESVCVNPSYWDQVCTACEEEYPWDKEYEWMPNTLMTPSVVCAITTYEQHKLTTSDGEGELDMYYIPSHGENPNIADT